MPSDEMVARAFYEARENMAREIATAIRARGESEADPATQEDRRHPEG